jgi:hypothetical protein
VEDDRRPVSASSVLNGIQYVRKEKSRKLIEKKTEELYNRLGIWHTWKT